MNLFPEKPLTKFNSCPQESTISPLFDTDIRMIPLNVKCPQIYVCEPEEGEKRRRKRSSSEDFIPAFSQKMYDRINQFMDVEGLDITSPNTSVSKRTLTLKAGGAIEKIKTLASPASGASTASEEELDRVKISKLAVPKFLLKRAVSLEVEKILHHSSSSSQDHSPVLCASVGSELGSSSRCENKVIYEEC